jgi:AraC family ethanolamine operon transcriptional activator
MSTIMGRIDAHDVEELNYVVSPWDLRMRQMSAGRLDARLEFAQVGGILVNRERWSRRVISIGATPAGYVTFAGGYRPETTFRWRGEDFPPGMVAYAFDSAETDFMVRDNGQHWVMLVPKDLLTDYLGEESAAVMSGREDCLHCDPGLGRQLALLADRIITKPAGVHGANTDARIVSAVQSQVLGSVSEALFDSEARTGRSPGRGRHQSYLRAVSHAEGARRPLTVPELAQLAGLSQRVLELTFREEAGVSPRKFLRWTRMNGMQRELQSSNAMTVSVTAVANRWGFTELGRTAVEYKQLFSESPSATLRARHEPPPIRLADALA